MPVSSAPVMPPTRVHAEHVERVVAPSACCFRPVTPHRQTTPATRPIANAPGMPTLPAAGVIATRPATAPDAAPSIDGLPLKIHSANVHASTAHAVARYVLRNASAADAFASSAEPALKPNQPNHSSEAPIIVIVRLCGVIDFLAVAEALADEIGADQAGDAGVDVHDRAAGEVERAHLPDVARRRVQRVDHFDASVYASGPGQNQTMCAIGR